MENLRNNWVNNNKALLRYYKNKYIAYTIEDDIIANDEDLEGVINKAKLIKSDFSVYFVSPLLFRTRIRPIHFKAIRTHDWEPIREFTISYLDNKLVLPMLVDSGADCSLISYKTGKLLGLQILETDEIDEAFGVGGSVTYIRKRITLTVDDYSLRIPVAWVQDLKYKDEIIGRETVFDAFDIEFKQAEEIILFKKRPYIS
jgi:hypothetical protein